MKNILVLDDDKFVLEYFMCLTRKLPYKAVIDGHITFESAVEAVQKKKYDLYILDFDLGRRKTGLEFFEKYLKSYSSKVILHSSSNPDLFGNSGIMFQKKPLGLGGLDELLRETRV